MIRYLLNRWVWLLAWLVAIAFAYCGSACARRTLAPGPSEQIASREEWRAHIAEQLDRVDDLVVYLLEHERSQELTIDGLHDDVEIGKAQSEAAWCALLLHVERPGNKIPEFGPWSDFERCSCGHGSRCNLTRHGADWRR